MANFVSSTLRPTFVASSIEALTPEAASENGIKVAVFDVDGTMTTYHAGEIEPKVLRMMHDLRDSGVLLAINSNAYGHRVDQLMAMYGELTDGEVITPADLVTGGENPRKYRKPSPAMLEKTGERFSVDAGDMLMAGDQLLKDIVAANRAGTKSLLVPRRGEGDYWAVRSFQRPVEHILRGLMRLPDEFPETMEKVA